MTRYSSTMTEALQEVREGFSPKQIKMAIGIAADKRYARGNYTGAVNAIEKIKKGLSDHPQVAAVLKRLNTDFDPELEEEVELDELKMDDPKLVRKFDKLKRGDTVKLKTSSTISKGTDFVDYVVKAKNTVNKGRVEKITLVTKGNEKAVKKFLYKRDGKVTFAIGDMGASIDDIKEGTWALPDSPKAKAELKKLMSKPIKLGKEGDDASDAMYSLIGDDELFDDLYVAGKKNPNGDARPIIKKAMKRLGIKEEVELEEKLGKDADAGDYIDDFKKSDAPQFKGKSDKKKKDMAIAAYLDAKDKKEEVELDELKEPFVVVDTADGNKVVGTASDEKGAKSIISTSQLPPMKIKDKKTLKIVKVKKKQMIGYPIKEEPEKKMDKPDSAKAVDQMRDDKKKTRIAQLQLQIAKATEMINKLNSQEKPDA